MATATITDQPRTPAGQMIMDTYHVGIAAGAGALAALVLSINPIGGAIFGAAHATANLIGRTITNSFHIQDAAAKSALEVASFILSIGIGIMAASYVGVTLTALGGLGMVFTMILTRPFAECTGVCLTRWANNAP